jgi:hypothetical protein
VVKQNGNTFETGIFITASFHESYETASPASPQERNKEKHWFWQVF